MTTSTAEKQSMTLGEPRQVRVVDCDTHPDTNDWVRLIEHMPEPWRSRYYQDLWRLGDVENARLFYAPPTAARTDAVTPGTRPGQDQRLYSQQVLQESSTDFAILIPLSRSKWWDPQWETARAAATNAMIAEDWLDGPINRYGRYRAGIRVSPGDPDAAVAEIRKWAGHPHFCQVQFAPESMTESAGHPLYRPVFREAARQGLPVALHITRETSTQSMTPVGYSSYHIEVMGSWSMYYASHLTSLIFDGVLAELPDLRVVFVEGGFTWVAPLLWRLDNYWKVLGAEVPEVRRAPSAYAREQLRITTQPMEEPRDPRDLIRLIEAVNAQDMLMFSSDYPHWDYDDPRFVASRFPASWRQQVMADNAIELYNLPRTRPTDQLDLDADAMTRYLPGGGNLVSGDGPEQARSAMSAHDFVAAD